MTGKFEFSGAKNVLGAPAWGSKELGPKICHQNFPAFFKIFGGRTCQFPRTVGLKLYQRNLPTFFTTRQDNAWGLRHTMRPTIHLSNGTNRSFHEHSFGDRRIGNVKRTHHTEGVISQRRSLESPEPVELSALRHRNRNR